MRLFGRASLEADLGAYLEAARVELAGRLREVSVEAPGSSRPAVETAVVGEVEDVERLTDQAEAEITAHLGIPLGAQVHAAVGELLDAEEALLRRILSGRKALVVTVPAVGVVERQARAQGDDAGNREPRRQPDRAAHDQLLLFGVDGLERREVGRQGVERDAVVGRSLLPGIRIGVGQVEAPL